MLKVHPCAAHSPLSLYEPQLWCPPPQDPGSVVHPWTAQSPLPTMKLAHGVCAPVQPVHAHPCVEQSVSTYVEQAGCAPEHCAVESNEQPAWLAHVACGKAPHATCTPMHEGVVDHVQSSAPHDVESSTDAQRGSPEQHTIGASVVFGGCSSTSSIRKIALQPTSAIQIQRVARTPR